MIIKGLKGNDAYLLRLMKRQSSVIDSTIDLVKNLQGVTDNLLH